MLSLRLGADGVDKLLLQDEYLMQSALREHVNKIFVKIVVKIGYRT